MRVQKTTGNALFECNFAVSNALMAYKETA